MTALVAVDLDLARGPLRELLGSAVDEVLDMLATQPYSVPLTYSHRDLEGEAWFCGPLVDVGAVTG